MNIQIWSDIACPFCYIGKRHLEKAIELSALNQPVHIEWKSFMLDPGAPKQSERTLYEILAAKYGKSVDEARQMSENVVAMAKQAGLNFKMDEVQPTNTFDAHRLLHYAKSEGKQDQLKETLLQAYFMHGKNVSDAQILLEAAKMVDLDEQDAFAVIDSDQYSDQVSADIQEAQKIGIQGVPFFLIEGKYAISGAQPVENIVQALSQIAQKEVEKA